MNTRLRASLALVLGLLAAFPAYAAKVRVSWTNPTANTDGSTLTDLASVTVQWGSCVGTAFGTLQSAATVPTTVAGAAVTTWAFPVDLSPVCIRAFATTTTGEISAPSNVALWSPPTTLGKPTPLGVVLHFTKRPPA